MAAGQVLFCPVPCSGVFICATPVALQPVTMAGMSAAVFSPCCIPAQNVTTATQVMTASNLKPPGNWTAGGVAHGLPACSRKIGGPRTTLVFKNLPEAWTRVELCNFLDQEGFQGKYDFVYKPAKFSTWETRRYAFVNMARHEDACAALQRVDALIPKEASSAIEVCWNDQFQGLDANVARYRNSPVMHPAVPSEHKPQLFRCGFPVPFPEPTKRLKAPKLTKAEDGACSDSDDRSTDVETSRCEASDVESWSACSSSTPRSRCE